MGSLDGQGDLAAQIWMAQDVPEQGAQGGCGTGTVLVKWQNDTAATSCHPGLGTQEQQ